MKQLGQQFNIPSLKSRSPILFILLLLSVSLIFSIFLFYLLPAHAADNEPSDTDLMSKQRTMEKDLEQRVQSILDKILGPNQSEVKATVNLSILKEVQKKAGSGQQQKKKEESPLAETKFILPGIPAPKNVAKEKEPDNVERQRMEQEKAQTITSFKINITNREVVAFYNEKLKSKEPEAKKAVIAMTDLKENELKFIPGKFFSSFSSFWEDFLRDPKNLFYAILLFLLLLLLFWLFVPLTSFFSNYVRAMKEKAGIEVKMESSNEEEGAEGEGMGAGSFGGGEGETEAGKEGDEEMGKKYAPFEYINEENMKRLLGVFRKESPQVIALVLSYLKPDLVKKIYSELPVDLQVKVAAESASLRQATEDQVRMVDQNIKEKIDFLVGGVDNLIQILDEVDYKIRDNILEYLMNHKPQLYEKVRSSILLFDDFLKFPDLAVQTIIRELKTDQLARALKNSSPELANKFFTNMSQGGAALLKEEMEYGRPLTEEQIEQERQLILNRIKELESEGKIQVREKKKISIFESEDATSPLTPSLPGETVSASRRAAIDHPELNAPVASVREMPTQPKEEAVSQEEMQSYLVYGEQLYSEGKYEEAVPYLQYAVQIDPNNLQGYQLLGHCYYSSGLMQQALECYEYVLSLSPEDQALREFVEQLKQSVGA